MGDSVKIHFQLQQDEDGYPPVAAESIWALPGSHANEYVVDNVPFFERDATLGDVILARKEDGNLWFEKVARRSENSLIRITFFDRGVVEEVCKSLAALGCVTEALKQYNLVAVSIPANIDLSDVQAYLQAQARAGALDYEEAILRQ